MIAVHPQNHTEWLDELYSGPPTSGATIINITATVSNKGRYDDKIVGGVAALLTEFVGGDLPSHIYFISRNPSALTAALDIRVFDNHTSLAHLLLRSVQDSQDHTSVVTSTTQWTSRHGSQEGGP